MTWLLDLLVRSSTILLLGLAVLLLLRRQSAALRHWILFATLICAAVVPAASGLLPSWDPPIDVAAVVPPSWATRMQMVAIDRPQTTNPTAAPSAAATADRRDPPAPGDTLLRVWLVGSVLSLGALMVGLLRLRTVDRDATPVNGIWHDMIVQRQSPTEAVVVRATTRPGLLLVWGVAHPTIIVPAAALSWPAKRIAAVLDHEFAHIRRQDWLVQIISEIIRAVYWFNPLIWIACARLRAECEVACDDIVIASGSPGTTYATHVVDVARELKTQYWLPAPAVARASTLERRVRAMLDKTLNRQPVSRRSRSAALAILAGVTLTIAAAAQSFVSLSGTIVDPSNGVLPGVKLLLTNQATQAKYEIQTDRTGRYEFVGLPPGTYTMEAALPGFSRISGRVTVGTQNLEQDLTMTIGMIEETITVIHSAAAPASLPPDPETVRKLEAAKQKRAQAFVAAAAKCGSAPAAGEVRMGGNIRVPMKLRDVRPRYPDSMRDTEGVVVLQAEIAASGAVEGVQVVSSPHPDLTQSAIDAVRQWEFDATLLNCEPIATPMKVTVNYRTK